MILNFSVAVRVEWCLFEIRKWVQRAWVFEREREKTIQWENGTEICTRSYDCKYKCLCRRRQLPVVRVYHFIFVHIHMVLHDFFFSFKSHFYICSSECGSVCALQCTNLYSIAFLLQRAAFVWAISKRKKKLCMDVSVCVRCLFFGYKFYKMTSITRFYTAQNTESLPIKLELMFIAQLRAKCVHKNHLVLLDAQTWQSIYVK